MPKPVLCTAPTPEEEWDPWKLLKERLGVRIPSVARKEPEGK